MSSILTNNGIKILMNRSFKSTPDYTIPDRLKIGADQATPVATDNDLTLPIPFSGTEDVDDCESTSGWNGSTDASAATLNTTSYKEGAASLNLGKTGTTSASITYSKAVTSLDFTSKTLFGWVYIDDVTSLISSGVALTVLYGSDNSNYYQYDYSISDLDDGWNLVSFTSSTATTVGSPVIASCDYLAITFYVDSASDTIAHGNLRTDDWKLASTDDTIKSVDSITINETARSVTIEGTVLATEANGFNITGFGFFNTDTSRLNMSIVKINAVSKSNTEELTTVQKLRFRRTTGG